MKILLVDDSEIDTLINERVLSSLGLVKKFHKASNGKEALKILDQYKEGVHEVPDIILLDLNMPVMDGFQFIETFQRLDFPNKERIRIIIVTSSSSRTDKDRVKDLGIRHYLTKPLDIEAVKSIILDEFRS